MTGFDPFADAFRKAVDSGEYARAAAIWKQYTAALAKSSPNRQTAIETLARLRELLEWARSRVQVANCVAARKLDALEVQRRYNAPVAPRRPALRLRG